MQFTHLTEEIVARNIEFIADLRSLDSKRRREKLDQISRDIESRNATSFKITAEDLRAIRDALDIEEMAIDIRKPL